MGATNTVLFVAVTACAAQRRHGKPHPLTVSKITASTMAGPTTQPGTAKTKRRKLTTHNKHVATKCRFCDAVKREFPLLSWWLWRRVRNHDQRCIADPSGQAGRAVAQ